MSRGPSPMTREIGLTFSGWRDNISTSNYLTSKRFVMPTHFTGSRAEMRTLDTFIKLTRCTNSLLTRLAERNTIADLTYSQFAVLETLYHLGPMTQGEVSQKV